jgi:lysophospholipase L1-like esterase
VEFRALYQFEKAPVVEEILVRGHKPDMVVLQECAVYFPGPLEDYQARFYRWIQQLKAAGIRPVIATTVPPAASQGWWQNLKDFVKVRVLRRESQYAQVVAFNRWLRELAQAEGIALLDLEQALRSSETDLHMHEAFNAGDGIHLNDQAYRALDKLLLELLESQGVDRVLVGDRSV